MMIWLWTRRPRTEAALAEEMEIYRPGQGPRGAEDHSALDNAEASTTDDAAAEETEADEAREPALHKEESSVDSSVHEDPERPKS